MTQNKTLTDNEAFDLAKAITSFEVWTENRCKTHAELNEYRTHLCKEVWVAAKQESEKEIASLVKAISLAADAREAALENTITELQSQVNMLREALKMFVKDCTGEVIHSTNWLKQVGTKALSATTSQSLAEHNER